MGAPKRYRAGQSQRVRLERFCWGSPKSVSLADLGHLSQRTFKHTFALWGQPHLSGHE
jgi:hypothetical protein